MSKHTKTPWTNDLTPMIKGGDKSIKINGFPLSVDYRILAEDNFQFAKHRVNLHDELVDALELALDHLAVADRLCTIWSTETEKTLYESMYAVSLALKKARGEV